MTTRILQPEDVQVEKLDTYLQEGWYRVGPALMTCRYVLFDGVLRSAIWTRLPLQGWRPSKSNRKLLSRNLRRFRLETGPAFRDEEKEALYTRYRASVGGERSRDLTRFLWGDREPSACWDTRELRLYEGDRLVAFSWFDVGNESVESLIGVYEPALATHSLGYMTMLLECQLGAEQGYAYHYSGYITPGDSTMDYKRRVGALEWLDPWTSTWRPWSEYDTSVLPTTRLHGALLTVQDALRARGVPTALRQYAMFDAPARHSSLERCLADPLFVECFPGRNTSLVVLVVHDLDADEWVVLRCARAVAKMSNLDGHVEDVPLLVVWERRFSSKSATEVADFVVARGLG